MTGQELIDFIINNHLEDYVAKVSHETGEACYPIQDVDINNNVKSFELI